MQYRLAKYIPRASGSAKFNCCERAQAKGENF